MSLGYYGFCEKIAEDRNKVLYAYGSANLNDAKCINKNYIMDGMIEIDKKNLAEPVIKRRTFKKYGCKRTETKKVIQEVNIRELVNNRCIIIENTKNSWSKDENGIDNMAYRLCSRIFETYQEDGYLCERCGIGW